MTAESVTKYPIRFRNILIGLLAGLVVLFVAFVILVNNHGYSTAEAMVIVRDAASRRLHRTSEASRVKAILAKKPHLASLARCAGGPMTIAVFKKERRVELHASGWGDPLSFRMTAFSGKLGPKLAEGDGQIPEGIYGIEYLNPNSHYHLSLKVSYPNDFDRARAAEEGRKNLGGDIMIHGSCVTIGCVPVGDDAIEDIFYLVHEIGKKKAKVIISPYDMRYGRRPELEKSKIRWYPKLCDMIAEELAKLPLQHGGGGSAKKTEGQ
jgi:murein L,D-transpeptidase YafK